MAIDEHDIETLKAYFVTRDTCDTKTTEINNKLANDNTRFAVIEQQLKTIGWVSKTTLAAVIVGIVSAILATIIK